MFASVAIFGAGVAGLVTARALAARGCAVRLIDDGAARAQNVHVHRLAPRLWQHDASLRDALHAVGCGAGRCGTPERSAPQALLPSKTELEAALQRLVAADRSIQRLSAAHTHLALHAGCWRLRHAGDAFAVDALIDATGAARATLPWLAAQNRALPLEQVPGRQTYVTQVWQGGVRNQRAQWRLRSASGHALLAHLAVDGRVTLTHLHDTPAAPPEVLRDALGPLHADGAVHRWRAVAGRRLLLRELPRSAPWFAVGDALVQTPPWQGQGVAQAFAHAQTLATHLEHPRDAIDALDALAQQQLIAASLGQWALPKLSLVA